MDHPNPETAPASEPNGAAPEPAALPGSSASIPQILAVVGEKEIALSIVRGELGAKDAEIEARDAAIASLQERIAELENS